MSFNGGRTLLLSGLACGLLGAIGCIVGIFTAPQQFFFSWLTAWSYAASLALGMLILLLICHAMNATWPVAIRRLMEAVVVTLPLLAILFVPIWFGMDALYPFTHPERIADQRLRALVEHKRAWLNRPFFIGRSVGYLAVWSVLAQVMRALSFKLDASGQPGAKTVLQSLSAATLPLVGITLTLASFDWLMALSPDWYSTMFGVYWFAGGFVGALALLVALLAGARSWFPGVGRSHSYALGRLLLAFVIFWAYIAFFQFFLIWIANKPIEARWYLERIRGGFRVESWLLGIAHFAVPFFLLLSYWIKQRITRLLPIASWLLVAHYLDIHWLVAPAQRGAHGLHWLDVAALFCVVGLTVAFGVWRQRGHLLAPLADPSYERALAYESV